MSGRTIWQAQDCAWWLRERVTELGEEFGPAGPAVANWLECQAKLQNAGGLVKTGYRAIARGCFLDGPEQAEAVVRFAVEIGFLKGFEEGSRTFEAVVSAFKADQARGRDTLNKQVKRGDDPTAQSEELPRTSSDKPGQDPTCPIAPRERRGEERTEEQQLHVEPVRLDAARDRLKSDVVRRVFEAWGEMCRHPQAKLTDDRRRKVEARLREGYSEADLLKAVEGCSKQPDVVEGRVYDDLALICKSGSKVEYFMARASAPNGGVASSAAAVAFANRGGAA